MLERLHEIDGGSSEVAQMRNAYDVWSKLGPTPVFDSYWEFAAKRQQALIRRLSGNEPPWSDDPVLQRYRFTNAYRACDRVSQYLIRHVIYDDTWSIRDIVFRILLFKIFNRIETWEALDKNFGPIAYDRFSETQFGDFLSQLKGNRVRIYSPAYIMPSPQVYGFSEKHRNHLAMLRDMIESGLPEALSRAKSMKDAVALLRRYHGIGPFLAYQYAIDINYSNVMNFCEMDYVIAGPGAIDGIAKCFENPDALRSEEIIRLVSLRQTEEFAKRGIEFVRIGARPLQLVDCQNLFCEISKYARVVHPEYEGVAHRTRIKQVFRPRVSGQRLWFPPKWNIDDWPSSAADSRRVRHAENLFE